MIAPYRDFHYFLSVEMEEDNRKNYHYAVRNKTNERDMALLNADPYTSITQEDFNRLVDEMYETSAWRL